MNDRTARAAMHRRQREIRGSGTTNFMVWSVFVLVLVFGTIWLVKHHYNSDWPAYDTRGVEGQSQMVQPVAASAEASPEPTALPPPAFSDFKRTGSK